MKQVNFYLSIILIVNLIGCSNDQTNEQEIVVEEVENIDEEVSFKEQDYEPINEFKENENLTEISDFNIAGDFSDYYGYIGDSAVHLSLDFNYGNLVFGEYFLGNDKITLRGKQTDWYGGEIYTVEEFDSLNNKIGVWNGLRLNIENVFKGYLTRVGNDETFDIDIAKSSSGIFIHKKSRIPFESESESISFFEKHKFHNQEVGRIGGFIIHDSINDVHDGSLKLLPIGLKIYMHDGGDGFTIDVGGEIDEDGNFSFFKDDSGYGSFYSFDTVIAFNDYGVDIMPIGYEKLTIRFDEIIDKEFLAINNKNNESIYLSIDELASNGYHLEGDGSFLIRKSGDVLGFYPSSILKGEQDILNLVLEIKNSPEVEAETILKISESEDGFFEIEEVRNINYSVWAKIKYNYYTEIPCSEDVREAKPSVNGWVLLYHYDEKTYRKHLVFDYYSKGC